MKRRDNLRTHVEDQHFRDVFSYPCPDCPMILGSKKLFYNHKHSAHKNLKIIINWMTNIIFTNAWFYLRAQKSSLLLFKVKSTPPKILTNLWCGMRPVSGVVACAVSLVPCACRRDVRNHVESIHFPGSFTYTCPLCEAVMTTKKALAVHKQKVHRNS